MTNSTKSRTILRYSGLFTAALLFQWIVAQRGIGIYDESLELYCADHVLKGQVPYRDFWTMYGPAQFYVLAFFFKLLGVSAMVGRLYDALVKAGIACLCFAYVSRLASTGYAALAFAFVVLWATCNEYPLYNFPVYPALLCSMFSILCLYHFLQKPSNIHFVFLAGLFVGLAVLFRHDSGFYICFAEVATLAGFRRTLLPGNVQANRWAPELFGRAVLYVSGILIVTLPVLLLLLWNVKWRDLFYDLFYVPFEVYPKVRNLPFLSLKMLPALTHPLRSDSRLHAEELIVYFPILIWVTSAVHLMKTRMSLFPTIPQRYLFAQLLFLDALLYVKGVVRICGPQELQSIMIAIVLFTVLMYRARPLKALVAVPMLGCGIYLIACSLPILARANGDARSNRKATVRPQAYGSFEQTCHPPPGLERARCMTVDPDRAAAIQYVEQRTAPTDKIYVGAGRHDKLFLNDVSFYFLSDRSSITKWYDLHPGVQTTLPIQDEIIASFKQYAPKLVVLDTSFDAMMEPNQSRYSSGVTALDDYIRTHYAPEATFGALTVLAPR